ncbi:hypothetical protein CPB84DRAFT_1750427 [Gymnopilus junonius]|uniref:Uncharacterized protein n=1 Tax=Gymnopilus junonius TaxID=109634 RepID=A0A9P5TJB5_GYMJU|nr:hypothetical protein CPB84DRAFT_1750427 [Gymnopilus junonius]
MDEFYDTAAALQELQNQSEGRLLLRPECQLASITVSLLNETKYYPLTPHQKQAQDFQISQSEGNMSWPLASGTRHRVNGRISAASAGNTDSRNAPTGDKEQQLVSAAKPLKRTLKEWHGTMFGASQAFETGARYFSRVTATMDRTMSIPFGDLVDPEGILERLVDDTYIHGPDNHVDYIWRIVTKEGAIQTPPYYRRQVFEEDEEIEDTERKFTKMRIATD